LIGWPYISQSRERKFKGAIPPRLTDRLEESVEHAALAGDISVPLTRDVSTNRCEEETQKDEIAMWAEHRVDILPEDS
jgi:hypothetical protein